jgi:hypothetical protein
MFLEINRTDIRQSRISDTAASPINDGEVLLSIDEFALTSNNISYALSGDFLDYWGFFPTEAGWGRLPAMGFGTVIESRNDNIPVGGRYFGFFPVGDFHVVKAEATSSGFVDVAEHRAKHAMAYRGFDKVSDDSAPDDHAYLLLRGLLFTSFLAEDFLFDNGMFGAGQIVVTSASSKTSIALAHRIRARGNTHCIGLTSANNLDFVERVNLYDEVRTYDDLESLADWAPTIVVDMAGNKNLLARIHSHFGDSLTHSCAVGATHWDEAGAVVEIPGVKPQFFFAPSQLAKRGKEWGRDVLNERIDAALSSFVADSHRWLEVQVGKGPDAVQQAYNNLTSGQVRPETGLILSM